MKKIQNHPKNKLRQIKTTARNVSYDSMICWAGLNESDTPRNVSPLEAMAMCQDWPHSAGGASEATARTMTMLARWS